jgi:hypothetical protein
MSAAECIGRFQEERGRIYKEEVGIM